MMMSKYSNFRNRTSAENSANSEKRKQFLYNSTSSIRVYHWEAKEYKTVVFTTTQREGLDESIIFVDADYATPIKQGDYVYRNNKDYLVFMEYDHSASELYKKFKLVECNGKIQYDNEKIPAAYFGSLRRYASLVGGGSRDSINISEEQERPVLIISDRKEFKKDFRFKFLGDTYKIIEADNKTNTGISYLSIKRTAAMTGLDTEESTSTIPDPDKGYEKNEEVLHAGTIESIETYKGYIEFDKDVEIIERLSNNVSFRVPLNIDEITISTKNENLEKVTKTYKVVL